MIPQHELNLDLPPLKRWSFLKYYRSGVKDLERQIMAELIGQSSLLSFSEKMLSSTTKYILSHFAVYKDDLFAVAQILDINPGRLLLMQLFYEASVACTSYCFVDSEGALRHFRTLDWDLPILKQLNLNLIVTRRGELLYRSLSWAGYLGCLTIMRPGDYSLSVNYRSEPIDDSTRSSKEANNSSSSWSNWFSGGKKDLTVQAENRSFWKNFRNLASYYWPVGYVVRYVAENYSSIEEARRYLQRALLISPTYFTLCGVDRAYVITRHCDGLAYQNQILIVGSRNQVVVGAQDTGAQDAGQKLTFGTPQYLIQTNIDSINGERCPNLLWSVERLKYLQSLNDQIVSRTWSADQFWQWMSYHPVLNIETIYAGLFCPRDDYWEIRAVNDKNRTYSQPQLAPSTLNNPKSPSPEMEEEKNETEMVNKEETVKKVEMANKEETNINGEKSTEESQKPLFSPAPSPLSKNWLENHHSAFKPIQDPLSHT